MCVHAFSSVWVLNHDGWQGEEQRARVCVHQDTVHLHPSPVNAAAAPLRLWDTLLTSQWILGDLSCGVTEFKPRMYAIHNSIFIVLLAFICSSFYFHPLSFPLFLLSCLTIIIFCVPSSASFVFSSLALSYCSLSLKTFLSLPSCLFFRDVICHDPIYILHSGNNSSNIPALIFILTISVTKWLKSLIKMVQW